MTWKEDDYKDEIILIVTDAPFKCLKPHSRTYQVYYLYKNTAFTCYAREKVQTLAISIVQFCIQKISGDNIFSLDLANLISTSKI